MLRSLTAKTVLALGLLAVFVAAMFALLLRSVGQQEDATAMSRSSELRVTAALGEEKLLIDIETGLRGYLITANRDYLEPYYAARRALPAQQARLRALELEAAGREELAAIDRLSASYVADYAWRIANRGVAPEHAARRELTREGKARMDALRRHFDDYVQGELEEARAAAADREAGAHQTMLLAIGGLATSVLLVLLVAMYQLRSVLAPVRRVGAAARRLATGDLTARVGEQGSGEIGDLAESFNLMATSLEYTRDELERQNAELESQQIELETTVADLAEQKRRIEGFQRFGSALAAETELESVADRILAELADAAGADVGALYVLAGGAGQAALLAVRALDADRLPLNIAAGHGLPGRALGELRVLTSSHRHDGLRLPTLGGEVAVAHEAYVPLVYGGRAAGVIALGRTGDAPFGGTDLDAVGDLTDRAALSIFAAVALRTARNQAVLNSAVIDTAADAFVSVDERGVVVQWNPAAERLFGRPADEAMGVPLGGQIIPERLRGEFDAFLARLVAQEGGEPTFAELIVQHADGSERTVEVTVSQLVLGTRMRLNAFIRDVTARKRLERYRAAHHLTTRGLSESTTLEEARHAILDSLGSKLGFAFGATLVPTPDGNRLVVTSTWSGDGEEHGELARAGGEISFALGEGIAGRVWASGEPVWVGDFAAETTAGPSRESVQRSGLRSGVAFPVFHGGRFEGTAMLFWTEERSPDPDLLAMLAAVGSQIGQFVGRKRAEAEADRLKDEFFALVSHELRTPLTSIIGYLELVLEDDGVDEQSRTFLNIVDRNAARLLRLVGDLLFVAQVEAGKLSLDPAPVDLRAVCAEAIDGARPKAEVERIELVLDAAPVPVMTGDAGRLGQALDNLVANAIKFTPPGGRVDVSLRTVRDEVVIEVADTGVGITDEEQQRLFDRFFRSQSAHEQAVQGVGLGLTIARAIVAGHGGRIGVRSREGHGSTFTVALPLSPPAGELPSIEALPQEVHS